MLRFVPAVVLFFISAPILAQQPQARAAWVMDTKTNCKIWDDDAEGDESVSWTGPCVNGLAEGNGRLRGMIAGKLIWTFTGEYKAGKMEGRGGTIFANGVRFEGTFKDNRRTGRGVLTMPSGAKYEGEFAMDKPQGQGVYTAADGQVFSGAWNKGCFRDGAKQMAVVATMKECGFR